MDARAGTLSAALKLTARSVNDRVTRNEKKGEWIHGISGVEPKFVLVVTVNRHHVGDDTVRRALSQSALRTDEVPADIAARKTTHLVIQQWQEGS
jgi:hypothetical protein